MRASSLEIRVWQVEKAVTMISEERAPEPQAHDLHHGHHHILTAGTNAAASAMSRKYMKTRFPWLLLNRLSRVCMILGSGVSCHVSFASALIAHRCAHCARSTGQRQLVAPCAVAEARESAPGVCIAAMRTGIALNYQNMKTFNAKDCVSCLPGGPCIRKLNVHSF